jgi:hypothetical protein
LAVTLSGYWVIDACCTSLQALEEVEKNFVTMRTMLSGDGESEPNLDQVSQLVEEICKEDVLTLIIHKLPILGWEVRFKIPRHYHMHAVDLTGCSSFGA